MTWFNKLKISGKLITGFLAITLIGVLVGIVGIININAIQKEGQLLYDENTLGIQFAGEAAISHQRIRVNALRLTSSDSMTQIETYVKTMEEYAQHVETNLAEYEAGIIAEEDRALYNAVEKSWGHYWTLIDQAIDLARANETTQASSIILGEVAQIGDEVRNGFMGLFEYNVERGAQRADANQKAARNAVLIMLASIAAGVLVSLLLANKIAKMLSTPIQSMVNAADRLAQGDVTVELKVDSQDEIGTLAQSFIKMIDNIKSQAHVAERIASGDLTVQVEVKSDKDLLGQKLSELVEKNNDILGNIAMASDQVATGSKQMSDSSVALSQGATEQASSVEQLTASIEEIADQTRKNAENANEANRLADVAKEKAAEGNGQMKALLDAMTRITHSSESISKIIKVIDEIAFQTNILSLNAAVEAARAGQHGKGFAVVAEEVRNLAARSAKAAKETTELIEDSIKNVQQGSGLAEITAGALDAIVDNVSAVATLVYDISRASSEQALGINQINSGIAQVSQVVQTNSATAEESAAASEELSSQAELLKASVSQYRLKTRSWAPSVAQPTFQGQGEWADF